MSLTPEQVARIAHLARIAVSPAEAEGVRAQLNGIFELIERMQAVDTDAVAPMAHAQDVMLRLRDDAVTEADQHERFQQVAPQVEGGLYLVPKVIE
jgi:aspartyl-tRNA(Asn)/glutamyl-tRNA(Gln) amidotransferase subunit C